MATSGSYNFTSTRNEIISAAFRKIGALGDYETIDTERLNVGIAAFNPMIKALANKGMPLWAITEIPVNLSDFATVGWKTIGPSQTINLVYKPLKLLQAIRKDTLADTDIELNIYTKTNFLDLASKESTGAPMHIEYQPLNYHGQLRVWPLPDTYWQTNGQLLLRVQRPFQDFDASGDEPDFPVEWHEALIYQLAVRLAPEYGLAGLDRQALKLDAKEFLDDALSFGTEEGSLYIMPEYRHK
jgi:hypothetical protein